MSRCQGRRAMIPDSTAQINNNHANVVVFFVDLWLIFLSRFIVSCWGRKASTGDGRTDASIDRLALCSGRLSKEKYFSLWPVGWLARLVVEIKFGALKLSFSSLEFTNQFDGIPSDGIQSNPSRVRLGLKSVVSVDLRRWFEIAAQQLHCIDPGKSSPSSRYGTQATNTTILWVWFAEEGRSKQIVRF